MILNLVSYQRDGYSAENSPAIFFRGGEPWLMSYCWRIYFKVLVVLFLAHVSHAFLAFKEGMWDTPLSALLSSLTVSGRFSRQMDVTQKDAEMPANLP
jgi:hypothetical protein